MRQSGPDQHENDEHRTVLLRAVEMKEISSSHPQRTYAKLMIGEMKEQQLIVMMIALMIFEWQGREHSYRGSQDRTSMLLFVRASLHWHREMEGEEQLQRMRKE